MSDKSGPWHTTLDMFEWDKKDTLITSYAKIRDVGVSFDRNDKNNQDNILILSTHTHKSFIFLCMSYVDSNPANKYWVYWPLEPTCPIRIVRIFDNE